MPSHVSHCFFARRFAGLNAASPNARCLPKRSICPPRPVLSRCGRDAQSHSTIVVIRCYPSYANQLLAAMSVSTLRTNEPSACFMSCSSFAGISPFQNTYKCCDKVKCDGLPKTGSPCPARKCLRGPSACAKYSHCRPYRLQMASASSASNPRVLSLILFKNADPCLRASPCASGSPGPFRPRLALRSQSSRDSGE